MARKWEYVIGGTGTPFSTEQMNNNIMCLWGELNTYGWSKTAIAGACGCFYGESGFNPAIYETSHQSALDPNSVYFGGGVGLAQWTDYPAYNREYPNPLLFHAKQENKNWYDGNFQCWLMNKCDDDEYTSMGYPQGPRWGWQTSSDYPSISFENFKKISGGIPSLSLATEYWFYCFEWHYSDPTGGDLPLRKEWARYAWDLMSGLTPEPPEGGGGGGGGDTPDPDKKDKKKMPIWMMMGKQIRVKERY